MGFSCRSFAMIRGPLGLVLLLEDAWCGSRPAVPRTVRARRRGGDRRGRYGSSGRPSRIPLTWPIGRATRASLTAATPYEPGEVSIRPPCSREREGPSLSAWASRAKSAPCRSRSRSTPAFFRASSRLGYRLRLDDDLVPDDLVRPVVCRVALVILVVLEQLGQVGLEPVLQLGVQEVLGHPAAGDDCGRRGSGRAP